MYRNKKPLSYPEVLSKMMKYCSYQERSLFEVNQKLREYTLVEQEKEEIVSYLLKENFLNEQRFAEAFVRGKVNVKRWGVFKIREGLSMKGVKSETVNQVLQQINKETYLNNFKELFEKKLENLVEDEKKKEKLYRFLQSKGYESDLIVKEMKERSLM